MKTFTTTLICILAATLGFAQNAPIDFESNGEGAGDWTWEVSENDVNPALEIIANPDKTAPNASDMVAKFTALKAGNNWALVFSDSIGSFKVDASNSTVKMMVWKPTISDVSIKFEVPGGNSKEVTVPNTKTNEWEELEFDFSSSIGNTYSRIVIIPDLVAYVTGKDRTQDNVVYFDNVTFSSGNALPEPTMAAGDPTKDAGDVISLFSNAYTDVTVNTWRTSWSVGNVTDIQIDGNDVKKYTDLNYIGMEALGANLIDASEMDTFHIDMWSPNSTEFKVKWVDFGDDEEFGGGDDTEHELAFTPEKETWVSLAIPMSDFTGLTSRADLAQFIMVSAPSGSSVVYVDNIYFSKSESSSVAPMPVAAANVYPNPASDILNVDIDLLEGTLSNISVINVAGVEVFNQEISGKSINESIDLSNLSDGLYFLKVTGTSGVYTERIIIE